MVGFFDRYYSLIVALALPLPLWLGAAFDPSTSQMAALHDGLVWSAVLLAGWFLVRRFSRYQIRGVWRSPTQQERNRYFRLLFAVMIIDFGSKAIFFRWELSQPVALFKNFGLQSLFHATPFESFHVYLMVYFVYLFLIGPLFFRYSNRFLDRLWLISCATALGGTSALVIEKFLFDGVHNSFYFTAAIMPPCPPCAPPRFINYVWTPADFFWHASIAPIFLLLASYFVPAPSSTNGFSRTASANPTLLQDGTS